jgi:hypothetical protein
MLNYFLFLPLFSSALICPGSSLSYKTNDNIVLCVFLSPVNYTSNFTDSFDTSNVLAFSSQVDVYSAVKLSGAYKALHSSHCSNSSSASNATYTNCSMNLGIQVAYSGLVNSSWAPYVQNTSVAKVFSIVVTLESGIVTLIEWDNFCDICDQYCVKWNTEQVCAEDECLMGEEDQCDPRIYVSYIGTDKDGNHLLSSSYRISQFRQYSILQLYSQAKSSF